MTAKGKRDDPAESATMVAATPGAPFANSSLGGSGEIGGELVAGRYRISNLVGRGGMGAVYRARDTELDEIVALKVLQSDANDTSDMLERFRREVKLARRVTHPNVARTYDIGEHGGAKFLTMEFIEGESLAALLQKSGRLPISRVMQIAGAVCAGLAAAHRVGVVHRDLKPDNVLVARDGRVVITDFGIARDPGASAARATVGAIGTPAYMAPEQVEARGDIDARADLYAFGVMLYELLTGELPWKGSSPYTMAAVRLYTPPPDPRTLRVELAPGLAEVVLRCMALLPKDRYTSADELAEALAAGAAGVAQAGIATTRPVSPPAAQAKEKTVAVLPFRNLGAADDEYVADGITDDLIDALSMTAGLRVRPRGAVVRYKGLDADPRQIGKELGVEVVVEGSVRKTPTQVRLTARLMSVEDGFQLWAQRFDRPANDILVMSDESARAIAEALTVHGRTPRRVAPTDAVAVDLYLKARAELRKYWPPHIGRAVELFAAAHSRAPNDTSILSGYARACARAWFFGGADDSDVANQARRLADRAVALSPDNPEALLALGSVRLMDGSPASAAEYVRRARFRAPDNPEALEFEGRLLLEAGNVPAALSRLEEAVRLDQSLGGARQELIRARALNGEFERVLELFAREPTDPALIPAEAVLHARLALWSPLIGQTVLGIVVPPDAPDDSPWFLVRLVQAVLRGDQQATERQLRNLHAFSRHSYRSRRFHTLFHQLLCEYHASLGDPGAALDNLEQAVAVGLFDAGWIEKCPALASLADEARFESAKLTLKERAKTVLNALGAT